MNYVKFLIALLLFVCSIEANGQDEPERNDLPEIQWLSGTWEGSGFANSFNKPEAKFDLLIQCTKDSMKIVLSESTQKFSPQIYINQTCDYVAYDRMGLHQIIRLLFLNPYREGGRHADKVIFIFPANKDHINLSLVYYARQEKEKLIMHGAFKRKK